MVVGRSGLQGLGCKRVQWLPRPFAGGMIFPWWTRTACLGPSEAGSVVLIYLTRAGQSRGHLVALRPVWVPLPRWTRWLPGALAGGTRWVYTFRFSSISASRV